MSPENLHKHMGLYMEVLSTSYSTPTRAITTIIDLLKLVTQEMVEGVTQDHFLGNQLPKVNNGGYSLSWECYNWLISYYHMHMRGCYKSNCYGP